MSATPSEFDIPLGGGLAAGLGQDQFDGIPEAATVDLGAGLEGDPAIAFRRTMGMFATGVTVLTTRHGDQVHGMTANAFMSVSLEPPLVLVSIDKKASMNSMLSESVQFGVSVLGERQGDLSDFFARRRTDLEPEFEVVRETPLVQGALAHVVARVVRTYWGGDHSLFLGQVEYARYGEGTPLLFHSGRYERLIAQSPLLGALAPEVLEPLLASGVEQVYAVGEVLMEAGHPGEELLIVLEGTGRVERPGRSLSVGPGEVVGEMEALCEGMQRLATVTAETQIRAVVVHRDALREALASSPAAAWALLGLLATRFREQA
jgi:flavin reductase (DIM6/NTAB) family NADH-FMN oxidoreductase RutF